MVPCGGQGRGNTQGRSARLFFGGGPFGLPPSRTYLMCEASVADVVPLSLAFHDTEEASHEMGERKKKGIQRGNLELKFFSTCYSRFLVQITKGTLGRRGIDVGLVLFNETLHARRLARIGGGLLLGCFGLELGLDVRRHVPFVVEF